MPVSGMACGYYFSLILLGLGFITTLTAAAPTNDCDRAASKQQADILREWAQELARAVNFAVDTESVLAEVAK